MILFSGIRTASGNGDNFNVAGSGNFVIDTYQYITGASILGQIMVINLNRSAYTLEKTKDAFNPYFGRAVPGMLGTNAKFSAVSWDDAVISLGKTGILTCDGRQNLRTDDKIPNFTREEIDQTEFNLTYGGFNRLYNQFMWSYKVSEAFSIETGLPLETQNSVLIKKNTIEFLKFTIIWIACNLSIPFWVVGHVHLTLNVYEDIHEIITSLSMNIIVALGFWLNWKEESKNKK